MTYKSSPLTFIFKYIFPILILGCGTIVFLVTKNSSDAFETNFANAFGVALVWVSIFLIQNLFKLKNVEVDDDGLKMKSGNGQELIPYENVIAVSKFDLSNPWMITVRFLDSMKNGHRKISYMPNAKYQRFMKDDEMTAYIIAQAKLKNVNFEASSVIKNLVILFMAGLPFFVSVIYFMSKSGFNIF